MSLDRQANSSSRRRLPGLAASALARLGVNRDKKDREEDATGDHVFPWRKSKTTWCSTPCPNLRRAYQSLVALAILACLLSSQWWYTPVLNSYFDLFYNIDIMNASSMIDRALNYEHPTAIQATPPNVIFIQHESLSGSIMLNTEKGRSSMPFLQDLMHNDPDMYVFEHHRTGSGNTIDAMPALMTGCLPYTEEGVQFARAEGRSIGYDFKDRGYSTASFSSRALDDTITKGEWTMLHDLLVGGMDRVEDPMHNPKVKLDNGQGGSDWQMLPLFEEWLAELDVREESSERSPFYAQFYNFNQHYPYLKGRQQLHARSSIKLDSDQYYNSLKATDRFLQTLFETLSKTGRLENTIIVASGDHGEDLYHTKYARLEALTSHILHTASYIYYPRRLMPDDGGGDGVAETLRRNTRKLTHTLDVHPTMRSILRGTVGRSVGAAAVGAASEEGCIAGVDLTTVEIPDDRVALSWNLGSSETGRWPLQLWSLSTKEAALYHRAGKRRVESLQQGRFNDYVLHFGLCTHVAEKLCMTVMNDEEKEHFRRAVVSLRNSALFGEGVKMSKVVEHFASIIGGELAIEATVNAMAIENSIATEHRGVGFGGNFSATGIRGGDSALEAMAENAYAAESPMEKPVVIIEEAPPQDAIEPVLDPPSGEGSVLEGLELGLIHLVQSFQKRLGIGNDDPPRRNGDLPSRGDVQSSENVLLFMPAVSGPFSIERQLKSYTQAAMLATFLNRAMLVLDAPLDFVDFDSNSQFGCPTKSSEQLPLGLSSIVKSPDWLSRKLDIPCEQTHGYSDWNDIRQSNNNNDIPETVCINEDGRHLNILIVGGDKTHDYFENFKYEMLQRPSPVAYDWALRLGANPQEAEIFSKMEGEQMIWDYLGALVARSDLLRFQPGIMSDVAEYAKKSNLPADGAFVRARDGEVRAFDAVLVRRGDELLSDPEVRSIIQNYWDARGGNYQDHIPLLRFLRSYHYKCREETRVVYISTNDPTEVKQEIANFGQTNERGEMRVGCNTIQFIVGPFKDDTYIEIDSCAARYSSTIASITDFIIFRKVETFVGDFNSDWGRLLRMFRLKLNKNTSENDESPVSLTAELAWGNVPRASPL